jgi:RhoGEF, Guanine nucleotide exchange factor for Rho/Rac/Cdc42-like GTPases
MPGDIWKSGAGVVWRSSSRTDRVRNEVLQRVVNERNIVRTLNIGRSNWIDYVLRRNCVLQDVKGNIEGRIEVTRRRRTKP